MVSQAGIGSKTIQSERPVCPYCLPVRREIGNRLPGVCAIKDAERRLGTLLPRGVQFRETLPIDFGDYLVDLLLDAKKTSGYLGLKVLPDSKGRQRPDGLRADYLRCFGYSTDVRKNCLTLDATRRFVNDGAMPATTSCSHQTPCITVSDCHAIDVLAV